jgi:tetratricopeptide (TPR) repeat protein
MVILWASCNPDATPHLAPLPFTYVFSVVPTSCRQNETMRDRKTCRRDAGSTLERHHEASLNTYPFTKGSFHGPRRAFPEAEFVKCHASVRSEPAYCFLKMPMKSQTAKPFSPSDALLTAAAGPTVLITLVVLWFGAAGCSRAPVSGTSLRSLSAGETKLLDASKSIDPQALVVAPHAGTGRLDSEIRRFQEQVRAGTNPNPALERLGWLFVAKARESFDPGYYRLAQACAQALEERTAGCPEALLLRGHVLQNLHRFKEAEPVARELVARRGLSFDYALLGDALMEQGRLAEAVAAYQFMIDLRPDLHSYARGAHIRWLKGDLTGALELMQLAVSASSPLDPESAAWVQTRLAFYRLQAGALSEAYRECDKALQYQTNYPPALLLQGRILLAERKNAEAIEVLQVAAERNPLPEYQWALVEALRQMGRGTEAVESQLDRNGAANDPRTYSLYLATRGQSLTTALRLAEKELQERADVFTHDALAWSLAASGKLQEAQCQMEKALAEGTQDPRLFFHAAVIAAKAGTHQNARHWFEKANEHIESLLPTEQQQLQAAAWVAGVMSESKARPHPVPAGVGFFTRGN